MSTQTQFFQSVLSAIGAPVTANNLSILNLWADHEGKDAFIKRFNPLNTTQNAPGATVFNSAGVKGYPDYNTGVAATAKTLTNKYYPWIIYALRSDKPIAFWRSTPGIWTNLNTWGTTNFTKLLQGNSSVTLPTVNVASAFQKKKSYCLQCF